MTMTLTQQILTILMVVLGTMLTRFLPFLVFPAGKPTPRYVQYLGKALPGAVFGLLIIYCLKNVSVFTGTHAIPELIAIARTVEGEVEILERMETPMPRMMLCLIVSVLNMFWILLRRRLQDSRRERIKRRVAELICGMRKGYLTSSSGGIHS